MGVTGREHISAKMTRIYQFEWNISWLIAFEIKESAYLSDFILNIFFK